MNNHGIESIKRFFKKNPILFLISVSLLMVTAWFFFAGLLNPIQGQWIAVALTMAGVRLFGYSAALGFKRTNTARSLRYTALVLAGSLYSLILSMVYVKQHTLYIPGVYILISIVFQMFGIAFFEELLCRGIILNTLLYIFGSKKKGPFYAVSISSLLFGLSHLTNLINRPYILPGIISQVIYTTMIGMVYAVVYIKYKNIWSIIITHGLFNLLSLFPFVFLRLNYWLIPHYFLILHSKPLIALFDGALAVPCCLYVLYLCKKFAAPEP